MMPLYVYALTDAAPPPVEVAGQHVGFVRTGEFYAAAVTMTAMPRLTEAALREQHEVVGAIAERVDALLPARFGSLVDGAELDRVVALRRDAIAAALALVRGCEQMTVRIFGDAGASTGHPALPATGTEYLAQRVASVRLPASAQVLASAVRPLVKAERAVRGERGVVATLYHLIARGHSAEYQAALEPLRADFPGPGFIVSGPWPPFAFAPELWA